MVNKMRVGRVFLLGDAAHIHSPVGGQGMNLGMQDAFNLCAKLQCVLQKNVHENLLDNYEKERMPIIKKVLRNTDRAMKSGIEQSFLSRVSIQIAAKIFAPIFFHSKFLQRRILNLASQIHSARKEINTMRALASQKR
jgi:2-polyprenyl-6-methoxyphenol hydroxylase-like FAD-dependent oxidoreductase